MRYSVVKPFGYFAPGKPSTKEQFDKQAEIVDRLTDPKRYPKSYKARIDSFEKEKDEIIRRSQTKRESKVADLEVFRRLSISTKIPVVDKANNGYPNGFKPVSESEKQRIRNKLIDKKMTEVCLSNREMGIFNTASSVSSSPRNSKTINETEQEQPKRMSGYVEDMPPPQKDF